MDQDPDQGQKYWQGHFGTKEMAEAFAADIEKLAAMQGEEIPNTEVTRHREGGWNVWIWE